MLNADAEIDQLSAALRKAADPSQGITSEERQLTEKFQGIGKPAIPSLLLLLEDPNPDVRELAAYTLRDIDGLSESDLTTLIASQRKEDGWLPIAIARIGTPKAVDFVFEEFLKNPESHTQITGAIVDLGPKAVPGLIAILEREDGWDTNLESAINEIFSRMGPSASDAIEPLIKIASDDSASIPKREHAISAIGSIGPSAIDAAPALARILKNSPAELRTVSGYALQSMHSPEAVPFLLERYKAASDINEKRLLLRDISEMREAGREVGSVLLPELENDDWSIRAFTARALGYIGYGAAVPSLRKLLKNEEDWRLVAFTAEALARFQDKESVPAIKDLERNYWYPPVRKIAREALESLEKSTPYLPSYASSNTTFPIEFFAYGLNPPDQREELANRDVAEGKLPILSKPGSELSVPGGKLVATDNGEWGGAIEFVDESGRKQKIFDENASVLYQVGDEIFALTGLAHMGSNEGAVAKIRKGERGEWIVANWRILPGDPRSAVVLKNGDLLANCFGSGLILVSPDGKMKYLEPFEVF